MKLKIEGLEEKIKLNNKSLPFTVQDQERLDAAQAKRKRKKAKNIRK
jgi:hypothetical protein